MINLTANPYEAADLHRPDVCLNSLRPPARNACKAVASVELQEAHDVASCSGSAAKNAVVLTRTNVHQNVHQMIKKDRFGYLRIRLDFVERALKNRGFLADSDPRLQF